MHCLKYNEDIMFKKLIDESVFPNKLILKYYVLLCIINIM